MSFKKSDYYTVVQQASDSVPGFKQCYHQFIERATLEQNSKSMVINYSRCVAQLALHFGQVPHLITTDEINAYLYRLCVHEGKSEGYFKQAVYGLRYWFRLFGVKEVVLSKLIADKLPRYLNEVKPKTYLFEGLTPGEPMGERSIQYVINEAVAKTSIQRKISVSG